MVNTTQNLPKAVQDCHELLLWLIPQLDKFPRVRRFTLGERLESGILAVLELIVEAAYRKDKLALLRAANRKLAVVRHLWRLAYELQVIPVKRFKHGAQLLDGLGSQIGAWQKTQLDAT
jgi:hypothetical protein